MKRQGYDLDRIAERVAEIYGMETYEIMSRGKQPRKVRTRGLLCFWAVSELGMSIREVVKRLEMSPPEVGFQLHAVLVPLSVTLFDLSALDLEYQYARDVGAGNNKIRLAEFPFFPCSQP